MSQKIMPPKIEWVDMTHWNLKDLETSFVIPDYERRPSESHIVEIMNAIRSHTFYDTLIRGYKRKDGKITLVDFQHRWHAFIRLYKAGEITHYDFMLALYPEQDAIAVYRSLNIGKALSSYDHYKALARDHPFTKKLASICYFYRNQERLAFLDVLLAVTYAKTQNIKANSKQMEKHLLNLTPSDIDFAEQFVRTYKELQPKVAGNPLYRSLVLRSLCRIMYERQISKGKLAAIQTAIIEDADLLPNSDKTTGHRDSARFFDDLITVLEKRKVLGGSKH